MSVGRAGTYRLAQENGDPAPSWNPSCVVLLQTGKIVVLIQHMAVPAQETRDPGLPCAADSSRPVVEPFLCVLECSLQYATGGLGLGPRALTWRRGPGMRALMGFVARLSQASVSTESITARSQSKHRNSTHQSEAAEKMCSSPGEAKCAFPCWPVHCLFPSLYPWSVSPYSTGWRGCCRLLVEAGELSF